MRGQGPKPALTYNDLRFIDKSMVRRPGYKRQRLIPVRTICDLLGGISLVTLYTAWNRKGAYRDCPKKLIKLNSKGD